MIDTVKGSLLTGALGDAYGHRFVQADLPASDEQWQSTDTFHYSIATCLSILEEGGPHADKIAAKMRSWYMEQQLSGLGQETLKTLSEMVQGEHWTSMGSEGDAHGNKAILRIAPLAFVLDPNKENELELIRTVVAISHTHPEAQAGALATLLSIRFIQNDKVNFIQRVIRALPDSGVKEGLERISQTPPARIRDLGRSHGCGNAAAESVPFSIFAAQQAPNIGLEAMMKEIVAAGGDTHGNCTIAGYIAGAYLGTEAVPEVWLAKMRQMSGFDEGYDAIKRFAAYVQERSGIQTLF